MALQNQFMVANNTPGQDLTLTPLTGTSIKVTNIYISNDMPGFATVEIGKTTVGYFRVDSSIGNHLSFPVYQPGSSVVIPTAINNGYDWLIKNTDFDGYPVGQGETFRVKASWGSDSICAVVYEVYDAADMRPSMSNGSHANTYHIFNYGEISGGISGAGLNTVNTSVSPVQFPSFPFGESCPSNTKISILGIAARNIQYISGTAGTYTTTQYIKMTRDRTVLFDEAKNGLRFYGGDNTTATTSITCGTGSLLGDNSSLDARPPFQPPLPLIFNAGDELLVQIQTSIGTAVQAIPASELDVCMIEKIEATGGV